MIMTSSFLVSKPQYSCTDMNIRSIIDIIVMQSVFAIFLQSDLSAKQLNVIIIRQSTTIQIVKIALALCSFQAYQGRALIQC